MREIINIFLVNSPLRLVSLALMMFLLSFLTLANAFQYNPGNISIVKDLEEDKGDAGAEDCSGKRPINAEEEKSSRNVSNSLNEEYLHEHISLSSLDIAILCSTHPYIHPYGLGDDHSSLDCPPPDRC